MLPLPDFEIRVPTSLAEASTLLAELGPKGKIIAGGTDLVPNLKHELYDISTLISLAALKHELDYVSVVSGGDDDEGSNRLSGDSNGASGDAAGGLSNPDARRTAEGPRPELAIGAMTPLAAIRDDEMVRRHAPALSQAAGQVASPQIQNMGTIGGNLCVDTRCVYYNQTHFWRRSLGYCLKKDGTECFVVKGGQNCVAAASSDTAVPMLVHRARFRIVGPSGVRWVSAADFYRAPGDDYLRMEPGEILAEIRLPLVDGERSGYHKLRVRGAIDFPVFSLGACLQLAEDGTIKRLSMAATALGSKPRNLTRSVAKVALGSRPELVLDQIGEIARKRCVPLSNIGIDADWRRAMIPVITRRLLAKLAGLRHTETAA